MALSWNEIKDRALKFSKEWKGTENEEADAKPFLVEFFNVFGISSKRVSTTGFANVFANAWAKGYSISNPSSMINL